MGYLVRFVLGLYPPWWRRRYGNETQELTEELLADPDANRWRILVSLLFGATTAWSHFRWRAAYLQPMSAGGPPMLPPYPSNPPGNRRAMVIGVVVGLMCVALICVGTVVLLNGLRSAVAGLGQGLGQLATQSAADHALAADGTAKTHHIPDGALTLGLLNQQNVDVKWLPGNISVPKSGDRTYLSISVGGDHIVTAANIIGCTYGLTVSTANDPIIGQDKLHGVGTYYEAPTEKQSYTCSTDSAPTSGWQPANSSQLKQISSPTSG